MELLSIKGAGLSAIDILEHLTELMETIPEVYWDRLNVFDGQKAATTLLELWGPDIDFAIELDPTKPLPKPSRPYHMNQEERAECQKVLDEMLNAGWVEPADIKCPDGHTNVLRMEKGWNPLTSDRLSTTKQHHN
jgi:hypothetical protein